MTVLRSDEEKLLGHAPLRFTVRIKHFSRVSTRAGVYASHVFRADPSGVGWSLAVDVDDASDVTVFRLQRRGDHAHYDHHSVRVRLTVADWLGSRLLSTRRQLHFEGTGVEESRPVMRLKNDQIVGCLKGLCFLPNDTLTLKCEIDESAEDRQCGEPPLRCGRIGLRDLYLLSVLATGLPLA